MPASANAFPYKYRVLSTLIRTNNKAGPGGCLTFAIYPGQKQENAAIPFRRRSLKTPGFHKASPAPHGIPLLPPGRREEPGSESGTEKNRRRRSLTGATEAPTRGPAWAAEAAGPAARGGTEEARGARGAGIASEGASPQGGGERGPDARRQAFTETRRRLTANNGARGHPGPAGSRSGPGGGRPGRVRGRGRRLLSRQAAGR